MTVFIFMTVKIKPFNYGKFNVWEIASLIAVLYLAILASVSNNFDPEEQKEYGWFIGLIIGWAIIFGVAYFITRNFCKNLLVPPGIGQTKRTIGQSFIAVCRTDNIPDDNNEVHSETNAPSLCVDRPRAPCVGHISYSSSSDGSPSASVSLFDPEISSRAVLLSTELQSSLQNEQVQDTIVDEIADSSSSHSSSKEDSKESGYDKEEHIEENKTSEVVKN